MQPVQRSPLLRRLRQVDRLEAAVWVASGLLLVSGWMIGSHLRLWDAQVEGGFTFCLDSDANCPETMPSPNVNGEFLTFGLLVLGGIACCAAVLLPLLRNNSGRHSSSA